MDQDPDHVQVLMLRLIFTDENGDERSVEVDAESFTIGRHSACDLTFPDSRLSREHARIERTGSEYVVSDLGSSNGTRLNGGGLSEPATLKDGDAIDLGGGLTVVIELTARHEAGQPSFTQSDAEASSADLDGHDSQTPPGPFVQPAPNTGDGIPISFFVIAPLLGIFVLAVLIGAALLLSGQGRGPAGNDEISRNTGDDERTDDPVDLDDPTPKPVKSSSPGGDLPLNSSPTPASSPTSVGTDLPSGGDKNETGKVEQNGAAFLRQIAQNDPKAFLTGDQAARVNAKVKQLSKSALADNISSARKNASAIKALAAQKNLKPQFLAVAAITKLGSSRGDVLQAAQSIADTYDKLAIHIGSENSDDALLMVAAYGQAAGGDTMKMRNMLQDLASKSSAGAREIRSIWFLEKNSKITPAEYDQALSFLAIGTIAQNPKDFGVNTEALKL